MVVASASRHAAIALSNDDTIVPQYVESSDPEMGASLDTNYRNIGIGYRSSKRCQNAANKAIEVQIHSMRETWRYPIGSTNYDQ